jgi:hypothetical protein
MKAEIEKYRNNLLEIKRRIEVIDEHILGIRSTRYLITEVEFLCLQFRKILELIALSSLVANRAEYIKQHEKFAKHCNARLIFQDLERINPGYYPVPTNQVVKEKNGEKYFDLQQVLDGYLTKEEFIKIYNNCGRMMHAENPYGQKKDIIALRKLFPIWRDKIVKLLNHHNITLVDNDTMIIGLMHGSEDGQQHVFEFKLIKKKAS